MVWWPKAKQGPQVHTFHEHGLGQAGKLQESTAHFAFELEPNQEQVSDQGGPDLDEHGILGGAIKCLDFQVLLDPFEEEFDLSAAAIKLGHLQGRQILAVG